MWGVASWSSLLQKSGDAGMKKSAETPKQKRAFLQKRGRESEFPPIGRLKASANFGLPATSEGAMMHISRGRVNPTNRKRGCAGNFHEF